MTQIILQERSYILEKLIDENDSYEIWKGLRNIFPDTADSKCNSRLYRVYLRKLPFNQNNLSNEKEAVKDEIRLLSYIYHKNCPYVEDAGEIKLPIGKTIFYTEHWWEGISLREIIKKTNIYSTEKNKFFIPISIALRTIREIADALDHIHNLKDEKDQSLNIIHRNIKPENIYYTNEGKILLSGFSSCKSNINLYNTLVGQIRGISQYTAPERIISPESYDGVKADIFSLGCILFEMITGIPRIKLSSSGLPNLEILKRNINIQALRNTVHPKLEHLINKMTNYNPDYRFNSVEEIIYQLDLLLDANPYRCFSSDVQGFINYIINKNAEHFFYIQKLNEREKRIFKTIKKERQSSEIVNPPLKAKQTLSPPQEKVITPQQLQLPAKNIQEIKPKEKNKINADQWAEIQKRLDAIMEENKTKRIEKSKVLIISGIFILFVTVILISLLILSYYSKTFAKHYSNKTNSSSSISSPSLIEDNLIINASDIVKDSASLVMEITILQNESVATHITSVDGISPASKSKVIQLALKKLNSYDWKLYKGKTLIYKFNIYPE